MNILKWIAEHSGWVLNNRGSFAVTTDFTANTVISSSQVNTNFADVETAINAIHSYIGSGVITNTMLAGSIDLTSKVTGVLPVANGGTEFDTGDICLSTAAKDETGWTEITSTYSEKYLRVGSTGLATGGASTHTHAAGTFAGPSHTHTVLKDGYTLNESAADGTIMITHPADSRGMQNDITSESGGTGSVTGTSAAGNNTPLYVDLRLFSKN